MISIKNIFIEASVEKLRRVQKDRAFPREVRWLIVKTCLVYSSLVYLSTSTKTNVVESFHANIRRQTEKRVRKIKQ